MKRGALARRTPLRSASQVAIVAHKTNVEMVHRLAEQADKLERLIRERGGDHGD